MSVLAVQAAAHLGEELFLELRVVGGILKGNPLPLGDGVNRNDVPFRSTFPYLAPPHSGFDSQLKRQEGDTPAVPGDPTGF